MVADEVRGLAGKTRESTEEIRQTIGALQSAVSDVVGLINAATEDAEHTRSVSRASKEAFGEIEAAANRITGVNTWIATATDEQSNVAAQITERLASVSRLASGVLGGARGVDDQT